MGQRGPAVFFDGVTSRRQQVIVDLAGTIEIREQGSNRLIAAWPYSSLAQTHTPDGTLRIGRSDDPGAARLEIRDEPLARAIDEMSQPIDRTGRKERRERLVVVGWGIAAVVSLALVAIYGIPVIADRLAPLLPTGFEQSVGRGVDQQVRASLNPQNRADFVCTGSPAAQAALARMVNRLVGVAQLHVATQVQVVSRPEVNAIALPGGYVYIFDGLIQRSLSGDQVAAVFAHELGHVANRDGMRSLLQQAGIAVILGVVIGDLGGSSLVIAATRNLLQARYSREVEAAADLYGILLLDRAGLNPRALAAALQRLPGATQNDPNILATHPNIPERVATLEARVRAGAQGEPVMTPAEFQALRTICQRPR